MVDLRGAVAWRVWAFGAASFERARATGRGGAGGRHFGTCGAQWDALVASDRPPMLMCACCGVRVRHVGARKQVFGRRPFNTMTPL